LFWKINRIDEYDYSQTIGYPREAKIDLYWLHRLLPRIGVVEVIEELAGAVWHGSVPVYAQLIIRKYYTLPITSK